MSGTLNSALFAPSLERSIEGLFTLWPTMGPLRKSGLGTHFLAAARLRQRDGGKWAHTHPGTRLGSPGNGNGRGTGAERKMGAFFHVLTRFWGSKCRLTAESRHIHPFLGVKTCKNGQNPSSAPVCALPHPSKTLSRPQKRDRRHGSGPRRHAAPGRAAMQRRTATTSRIVHVDTGSASPEEDPRSMNRPHSFSGLITAYQARISGACYASVAPIVGDVTEYGRPRCFHPAFQRP